MDLVSTHQNIPEKRILIILMGAIGDVVRGFALANEIKKSRPSYRITWLVEPSCAPLLALCSKVDRIVVFDRKRPFLGLIRLYKELHLERYDVALDLQRHFKSGFFSWLSKATTRIGFHPKDSKEFNWVFNNAYISWTGERGAKIKQYLEFLKQLDIDESGSLDFGINKSALYPQLPAAVVNLRKHYIVLVLGSSWETKDWPIKGYSNLIRALLLEYPYELVLCGTQDDCSKGETLAECSDRVINLSGQTSLPQLAALLASAQLVIGPDSGPAHISAALNIPHITLFGPTSAIRVAPWKMEDLSITSSVGCQGCYRKKCPGLNNLCMRIISPDMILETVRLILGNRQRQN